MLVPAESTTASAEALQSRMDAARDLVVCDSEIIGGMPTIRRTRIPVYDVAALAASGEPRNEILDTYPSLNQERVELAMLYAEANPLPPGPRQRRTIPAGATVLASYTVPFPKSS
jgi:uncharacterized protein (DUF433 family)